MRTTGSQFDLRSLAAGCLTVLAIALATHLTPLTLAAQGRPTTVEYDVEFSVQGSLLDANCAASGTDVLTGTLIGYDTPNRNATRAYVGTLVRTTSIGICGSRRIAATGTDVVCNMTITGNGNAEVILEIQAGQAEGYLQYISNRAQWATLLASLPRRSGPTHSLVTGSCDPTEMAHIQNEYDEGSTAGSPSGQPIDMAVFPPPSYPHTYAPLDTRRTMWSMKVLARRP